jgi:4-hydroxy 2-oxovalerate aldolase
MNSIHPTYVQEMLIDSRYSVREILQAINFMSSLDSSNYDKDLLLHAHSNANNKGSWNAKGWCMHKEVLVLGSGKSLEKYRRGVEQYIKTYNPIVVDINTKHNFPKELIDVYLSSNESNMLSEYDSYVQLDKPIIISKKLLESVIGKKANIKELWDYGLNIRNNTFMVDNTECTLPYELTIGYALALASVGGATSVSLVGFDGYDKFDIRQDRVNGLLTLFKENFSLPISVLTPTTYQIQQGSIYACKI